MPHPPDPKPEPRDPTLILASQSPRRAQLLREAGFTFTQQSPPFADPDQPPEAPPEVPPEVVPGLADTDESRSPMSPAERYAADLARQKAVSMVQQTDGPAIVLAADTLCVAMSPGETDKLIGKPRDRADAERMLRGFMNGTHAVVSGVALVEIGGTQRAKALADTAVVAFGHISDGDLDRYLDSDGWRGKAGGYNLFDRQQAGWPIAVEGDPATVVGLPMGKLVPVLAELGI